MKDEHMTLLPKSPCPNCGEVLDAATHPTEDVAPTPGDLTMCIKCGEFFSFDDGLKFRPLDEDALTEAPLIEIQRLRRAWRRYREKVAYESSA